jgi:hypothetical protein
MLGKFPKEIIINNIIRKELEANIVKIHNYYFNNKRQILVMENVGITLKELFIKENEKNNLGLINDKVYEIFIILTILQNKFKFMHKDLHGGNILMKKVETEFNNYIIDDKEYKIKSHGYIPVFIDFGYSTIFNIYTNKFEIYNTHKTRFKCITKYDNLIDSNTFKYKYFWYIRDINKFNPSVDVYYILISIMEIIDVSKIKIIQKYFELSGIKNYMYSESLLSPYDFILQDKKKSRLCRLHSGFGNKLYIIAYIIDKYKNDQLYIYENTSIHQLNNKEKLLIDIYPEIKSCRNPKMISLEEYELLKNKGVPEIVLPKENIFLDNIPLFNQRYFLQKYLQTNSYDYLLNKYDFENGIFVHIRFGDKFIINYNDLIKKKNKYFYTLLNESYYIDNINKLLNERQGNIYIFSDSPDIVKCLFKNKIDNLIYSNEDVYETFYCFIKCKRLIISESTLSIAAIFLNYNKDLIAIAPNFSFKSNIHSKIIKTPYKYPSNVILENNQSYILKDLKDYENIIKNCPDTLKLLSTNIDTPINNPHINLDIENNLKNKNKDKIKTFILNNGLGNKLFALANMINKYKNYDLYFVEKISHHQINRYEKKLKYAFPEIKNSENPKLISFTEYDILKKNGIEEIKINIDDYENCSGFIRQKEYLKKYFIMDSSYDYLLDKYDFKNGIFVHVRYGDKFLINYISLQKNNFKHFFTLLKPAYYIDNINKMLKEADNIDRKVYIFSDSIEMTKCLFNNESKENKNKFIYMDEGVYETFYCFTKCRRLIISESSLSIAAIYLNYNEDLKVIAPRFAVKNYGNIINTFYCYPSTVTFENNRSYLLYDDIKEYNEIIKMCKINIDKIKNNSKEFFIN